MSANSNKVSFSFHCSLCSQVFQNACCLAKCGHTFCSKCFKEKVQVNQREEDVIVVKCVSCHTSTLCIENAESELNEPVVETLIQILGRDNIPEAKVMCDPGECGREAEYWCPECENHLCAECFGQHAIPPFTKRHHDQVMQLDQKNQMTGNCFFCEVETSSYCEDCQKIVCEKCGLRQHKTHQFSDIEKKVNERKSKFQIFINQVKDEHELFQKKITELNEQLEKIKLCLKEESKKERRLKITHNNLVLMINDSKTTRTTITRQLNQVQDEDLLMKLEKELNSKVLFPKDRFVLEDFKGPFPSFEPSSARQPPSVMPLPSVQGWWRGRVLTEEEEKEEEEKLLVECNSILETKHKHLWNCLYDACDKGRTDLVRKLIGSKKCDVNAKNESERGRTCLIKASLNGHKEIVSVLIEAKSNLNLANNNGWTPLHFAARYGHKEIVSLLIRENTNFNLATNEGWTPLHEASRYAHQEIVSLLIRENANFNLATNEGWTPLHFAARYAHEEGVSSLIESKINLNDQNKDGYSPLNLSAYAAHKQICSILIRAKADHTIKNKDGRHPLAVAKQNSLKRYYFDDNEIKPMTDAKRRDFEEIVKLLESLPR